MKDTFLKTISQFTQDQWDNYIYDLAIGKETTAFLSRVADDDSSKLFWLYNFLLEEFKFKIPNLTRAVVKNLRTITVNEGNKEILYVFIYFLHEIKPLDSKAEILQLIRDERFINFYYGSDNLQYMLIRTYIHLEDSRRPSAEQTIKSLKLRNGDYYYLYLQVYYYAYLNKKEKALTHLSKLLTNKFTLSDEFYVVLENIFIDCVPDYLSFEDLLEYWNKNRVSVCSTDKLKKAIDNIASFWENYYEEGNKDILLFVNDYLNANEKNANSSPSAFERMSKSSKVMRRLILVYYDKRDYNQGRTETIDDLILTTIDSY